LLRLSENLGVKSKTVTREEGSETGPRRKERKRKNAGLLLVLGQGGRKRLEKLMNDGENS